MIGMMVGRADGADHPGNGAPGTGQAGIAAGASPEPRDNCMKISRFGQGSCLGPAYPDSIAARFRPMSSIFRLVPVVLPFFAAVLPAAAGVVSLRDSEVPALRRLVRTDPAAASRFAEVRSAADRALNATPDPVERVFSAAHLASDPKKVRSLKALADVKKAESLAWAGVVSGDARYTAQARRFLVAWAETNRADGNSINESKFEPMIVAYDLVRPGCSGEERRKIDAWLRSKAETLAKKSWGNNWACHQMKIVGLTGHVLGDAKLIRFANEGLLKRVDGSVKPDGSTEDFHERDALHYQIYFIQPLLTLARAGERAGEPLFAKKGPHGTSLKVALDFVTPYATGKETHVEFARSKVAFDRQRAAAGEKEYIPHPWTPGSAIELYREAAWFDAAYGRLAGRLAGKSGERFPDWQSVVFAVAKK